MRIEMRASTQEALRAHFEQAKKLRQKAMKLMEDNYILEFEKERDMVARIVENRKYIREMMTGVTLDAHRGDEKKSSGDEVPGKSSRIFTRNTEAGGTSKVGLSGGAEKTDGSVSVGSNAGSSPEVRDQDEHFLGGEKTTHPAQSWKYGQKNIGIVAKKTHKPLVFYDHFGADGDVFGGAQCCVCGPCFSGISCVWVDKMVTASCPAVEECLCGGWKASRVKRREALVSEMKERDRKREAKEAHRLDRARKHVSQARDRLLEWERERQACCSWAAGLGIRGCGNNGQGWDQCTEACCHVTAMCLRSHRFAYQGFTLCWRFCVVVVLHPIVSSVTRCFICTSQHVCRDARVMTLLLFLQCPIGQCLHCCLKLCCRCCRCCCHKPGTRWDFDKFSYERVKRWWLRQQMVILVGAIWNVLYAGMRAFFSILHTLATYVETGAKMPSPDHLLDRVVLKKLDAEDFSDILAFGMIHAESAPNYGLFWKVDACLSQLLVTPRTR